MGDILSVSGGLGAGMGRAQSARHTAHVPSPTSTPTYPPTQTTTPPTSPHPLPAFSPCSPPGFYSPANASACTACPLDQFSPVYSLGEWQGRAGQRQAPAPSQHRVPLFQGALLAAGPCARVPFE
jgi:hypothetical protein